jgi:hypothetical protein
LSFRYFGFTKLSKHGLVVVLQSIDSKFMIKKIDDLMIGQDCIYRMMILRSVDWQYTALINILSNGVFLHSQSKSLEALFILFVF